VEEADASEILAAIEDAGLRSAKARWAPGIARH